MDPPPLSIVTDFLRRYVGSELRVYVDHAWGTFEASIVDADGDKIYGGRGSDLVDAVESLASSLPDTQPAIPA